MQSTGFDGRVVFETTGPTMRGIVVAEGFSKAIPECIEFTGRTLSLFVNLIEIMARTKKVIVDTQETEPNIIALRQFWEFAHGNTDYRAVWDAFLDLPDVKINDEWVIHGLKIGDSEELKAPPEVRAAVEDEDELGEEKKILDANI